MMMGAKGRLLVAHLTHTALSVAVQHSMDQGEVTYSALKTLLRTWFEPATEAHELLIKWNSRRQKSWESPLEFAVGLMEYASAWPRSRVTEWSARSENFC